MRFLVFAAALLAPSYLSAQPDRFGQISIYCTFDNLPSVIFSYSKLGAETVGAMTVGGRGPVVMTLGSGSMRFEGGRIDGYKFRWSPQNSWMDVELDGNLIRGEQGDCKQVAFGTKAKPLTIR